MPQRELNRRGSSAPAARGNSGGNRTDAVAQLNRYASDFATVLPSHLDAAQWLRLAEGLLRRDEALAAVSLRNPASFFAALLECARLGLVPGDTYHLLPFGGDVVGVVDYKGEIELVYRAGMVRSIKCEVVYENDGWSFKPSDDRPDHSPNWFGDRGKMIGVYAYAEMKDGGTSRVVVLSQNAIDEIKAVSKTAKRSDSPWVKWPDRMWRKTAVKQLVNWIPSSAEFRAETLRAETAAAALPWGQVPPTRDYPEPPPLPMPDELPALEQQPDGSTANTVTGEVVDPPAGPPPGVQQDDDLPYDPGAQS